MEYNDKIDLLEEIERLSWQIMREATRLYSDSLVDDVRNLREKLQELEALLWKLQQAQEKS